jgi:colicin import membrane protein
MTRPPRDREPGATADTTADTQQFARPRPDADPTAAMSTDPGFRVSWRGYDRGQVDSYRSRLEADLATLRAGYEHEVRAHAQLSERLRASEADLARLRGQLSNSPSALSERLREILHLAGQDAEQTRAAAQDEARQQRADAQAEADQIRADAETVLKQAQQAAAEIASRARTEQQQSKADLEQEQANIRQRLTAATAEAEQAREHADAEAAARREQADRQARERREQADAAAAARLRETSEQLAELTRQRDEVIASLSGLSQKLTEMLNPPTNADPPAPGSVTTESRPRQESRHADELAAEAPGGGNHGG